WPRSPAGSTTRCSPGCPRRACTRHPWCTRRTVPIPAGLPSAAAYSPGARHDAQVPGKPRPSRAAGQPAAGVLSAVAEDHRMVVDVVPRHHAAGEHQQVVQDGGAVLHGPAGPARIADHPEVGGDDPVPVVLAYPALAGSAAHDLPAWASSSRKARQPRWCSSTIITSPLPSMLPMVTLAVHSPHRPSA